MSRTREKRQAPSMSAVGYVRVSTNEQGDSGLGIEAQRAAIEAEALRRGWSLSEIFEDVGASGKSMRGRAGLSAALDVLDRGDAQALLVSRLDRATRSVMDAAVLLERAARKGWKFVALDLGVDTTTPTGELVASVMAAVAQWERRAIGARTREALAVKRSQGVRLGRPPVLPRKVVKRIIRERDAGRTWDGIGRGLDEDGVATAQGGREWYPATVRSIYLANATAAA